MSNTETLSFNDKLNMLTNCDGNSFIELGEEGKVGGFLSHCRIRYIATPGGFQFAIKLLRNGMEGSGIYFPNTTEGRQQLYHRAEQIREDYISPRARIPRRAESPAVTWNFVFNYTKQDPVASLMASIR